MDDWFQVALSGFGVAVPLAAIGWYLNRRRPQPGLSPGEATVDGSKAKGKISATGQSARVSKSKSGSDIIADASTPSADPKA